MSYNQQNQTFAPMKDREKDLFIRVVYNKKRLSQGCFFFVRFFIF